ncbi:MAG: Cell division protein FtsL [Pelotomaculum sp. PtaU1.Bin035]|nr:MAG: Cell division protein FtsL [Pelotomaculum sp. PtaU1.Bin035]
MIVAQEKTGYYGIPDEELQLKKTPRCKTVFKGQKLAFTGFIVAGFLAGILITYYCSQLFALGYQICRLNKELAVLRIENYSLDEEIQRLVTLDRIESLAINKLKMVKPDANNVLVVSVATNQQETAAAPVIQTGQPTGISIDGKEKSRLAKAFDELVNRLENKSWLGRIRVSGLQEGSNANNKHYDPKKNNLSVSFSRSCSIRTDLAAGLASNC